MAIYTTNPVSINKVWYFNNQTGAPLNLRLFLGSTAAPASLSKQVGIGTSSSPLNSPLAHYVRIYASATANAALPLASCGPITPGFGFTVKATKVAGTSKFALALA